MRGKTMLERSGFLRWGFGLLTALLLGLYAILPSLGLSVFNSPDETALAVAANRIAITGSASVAEPLARVYPWLHPRSWITSGEQIVPVGFLGWPWFLNFWARGFGTRALPWIGAILILSAIVPFFNLLRERLSVASSLLGTIVAFTFPSVILYANRSLFANLPMLALGLWGIWLLRYASRRTNQQDRISHLFALAIGCVCALALAIRPFEAIWFLPWLAWAGWKWRPSRLGILACVIGVLAAVIPVMLVANQTYGSAFTVGYWLRDNPSSAAVAAASSSTVASSHVSVLPYGFHPRNVIWNVRSFLFGLLWPWTILTLVGFGWFLKTRWKKSRFSMDDAPWLLGVWTAVIVIAANGNGLYADQFQLGAVMIGNSFLRYVLPLAPLIGWVVAWMFEKLPRRSWKIFALVLAIALVGFGGWRALAADDEGILTTRRELQRYADIRTALAQWFHPGDVILSERSDKIAFPDYRAVSPLPLPEDVGALARERKIGVGLFIRPLTQGQKDAWRKAGLEVQELAAFGREKLYRLSPR